MATISCPSNSLPPRKVWEIGTKLRHRCWSQRRRNTLAPLHRSCRPHALHPPESSEKPIPNYDTNAETSNTRTAHPHLHNRSVHTHCPKQTFGNRNQIATANYTSTPAPSCLLHSLLHPKSSTHLHQATIPMAKPPTPNYASTLHNRAGHTHCLSHKKNWRIGTKSQHHW